MSERGIDGRRRYPCVAVIEDDVCVAVECHLLLVVDDRIVDPEFDIITKAIFKL